MTGRFPCQVTESSRRWQRNCKNAGGGFVSSPANEIDIPGLEHGQDQLNVSSTSSTENTKPADWREHFFPYCSFHVVITLILVGVIFTLSRKGIADPDIWWHLHNAQYLGQHHALQGTRG